MWGLIQPYMAIKTWIHEEIKPCIYIHPHKLSKQKLKNARKEMKEGERSKLREIHVKIGEEGLHGDHVICHYSVAWVI